MTRRNNLTKRSLTAAAKFIVPAGMYLEPINDLSNYSYRNSDSCSDDVISATKKSKQKRIVDDRSKKTLLSQKQSLENLIFRGIAPLINANQETVIDYGEELQAITISQDIVEDLLDQFKVVGSSQHNTDVQCRMMFVVCKTLLDKFEKVKALKDADSQVSDFNPQDEMYDVSLPESIREVQVLSGVSYGKLSQWFRYYNRHGKFLKLVRMKIVPHIDDIINVSKT